jgi:hypothetical protein
MPGLHCMGFQNQVEGHHFIVPSEQGNASPVPDRVQNAVWIKTGTQFVAGDFILTGVDPHTRNVAGSKRGKIFFW